MAIIGISLGTVSFNAMPSARQILQNDARRVALLMQLARDEAIVRDRPVAFEAEADRYRFLLREKMTWQVLQHDDLLREREFKHPPISFSMNPSQTTQPLRIMFGREPVDKPFVLTLTAGSEQVSIRADGIGHFVAE